MTKPIESPYRAINLVTQEMIDVIKKGTGASCVFVAISDDQSCDHSAECQGHGIYINGCGFGEEQLLGLANMIANKSGLKLVENDESDD